MIKVRRSTSVEAGSCNNCTAHFGPDGAIDVPVTVITISGRAHTSELRLCDDCLPAFKREVIEGLFALNRALKPGDSGWLAEVLAEVGREV